MLKENDWAKAWRMCNSHVRHINVTAKDKALINTISHSTHYPLPFALANGWKVDSDSRPRQKVFQGTILLSDACQPQAGNRIALQL